MSDKNVELIIDQVQMRLHDIQRAYELGDYDIADRQLSELRDVLDDIYDRPEEDVEIVLIVGEPSIPPRPPPEGKTIGKK